MITNLYIISNPLSLALYVRISIAEGKYRAALRHIDCAVGANIDLHIAPRQFSPALYVRISIAVYGKYHAALRHIDCSERANIDLHIVPSSIFARTLRTNIDCRRQISSRFAAYHLRRWRKYRFTSISPHPPPPRRRSPFPTKIASQSGEGWYGVPVYAPLYALGFLNSLKKPVQIRRAERSVEKTVTGFAVLAPDVSAVVGADVTVKTV